LALLRGLLSLLCHPEEHVFERLGDVVSAVDSHHVVYHFLLSIQYDVSKLSKVLNYYPSIIFLVEEDLA
jgi:hypothetical protein